jgi:hypothetical protein
MDSKLRDLLINEEQSRLNQNYTECLNTCLKILKILSILKAKEQTIFDILSKIFLKKNQSNFVRIGTIFHIIRNNYMNIYDNKNLKSKYYQLLMDSFKNDQINDKLEDKQKLISLFESSNKTNFKSMDSFILSLDVLYIPEKSNSDDAVLKKLNVNKELGINDNKNDLEEGLIHEETQINEITQFGLVDNLHKQSLDIYSDVQVINENASQKDNNNNYKFINKKYKVNTKLPMIVMSISVNLNTNDFMKLVHDTFIKLNYKNVMNVKSTLYDNINIYEYNTNNVFKKMVYCLFNDKTFKRNVFQVSTVLQKDENNFTSGLNYFLNDNNEKKLAIKTIKGNEKNIIAFMIKYLKLIAGSVNKIRIIKQSKILFKYDLEKILNEQIQMKKNILLKNINIPKKKFLIKDDEETIVEKSNKKVNRFYEIYKILSNIEYELGKSINDFVENFREKYKDLNNDKGKDIIETIKTRDIMAEIIKLIEHTTNTLNCYYNQENNINYNTNFYNSATEQFIFNKIYHYLYEIYDLKYKKCNEEFILVKKEINENMEIKDIISNLNIKKVYISNDPIPFMPVIENINKLQLEKCLKNKFKIITQSSLEIRNCILEYTGGKYELESMDDELPIIIYLVTQINIENLFAELYMIDDYIKCTMRDELIQNKMVTNLLSSLSYISLKWDKKTNSFEE